MKKQKNFWLFLIIIGTSLISLTAAWLLEKHGVIVWPEIKTINFSEDDVLIFKIYQLSLPMSYSRLWDALILPFYLALTINQGIKAHKYGNVFILGPIMPASLAMGYFFASELTSLIGGMMFILVCGIFFGRRYIIFLSLLLGLIVGITHVGLLHGFSLSIVLWLIILVLRLAIK